jgi:tryptophanyl-tRNA synthetase
MELLPGLDGRKMSKSYDNVVPLFEGGAEALRSAVAKIVTDSRGPGEAKEPEGTALIQIFDAFATPPERAQMRAELRAGLAWGEAKQRLVVQLERELGPMRAHYAALMADPERIEAELQRGAERARAIARPLLARLREAVGLRRSRVLPGQSPAPAPKVATPPVVKQYRETDGQFYVKLTQGDTVLALSPGFANGRDGAQWLATLKADGASAVTLAEQGDAAALTDALAALRAADAAKVKGA